MAIGDYREMRGCDIAPYQKVLCSLVKHYGSIEKAMLAIGSSTRAYYRLMNDGELTVFVARKIMAGYTAMQDEKAVAKAA